MTNWLAYMKGCNRMWNKYERITCLKKRIIKLNQINECEAERYDHFAEIFENAMNELHSLDHREYAEIWQYLS